MIEKGEQMHKYRVSLAVTEKIEEDTGRVAKSYSVFCFGKKSAMEIFEKLACQLDREIFKSENRLQSGGKQSRKASTG